MPGGSLGAGEAQGSHWQDSTSVQLTLLTLERDKQLPWANRGWGNNPAQRPNTQQAPAHGTGKETG